MDMEASKLEQLLSIFFLFELGAYVFQAGLELFVAEACLEFLIHQGPCPKWWTYYCPSVTPQQHHLSYIGVTCIDLYKNLVGPLALCHSL